MKNKLEIYKLLHYKKIAFNFNKNPIKMDDFISMLTVNVESNTDCSGYFNGWRSFENKEHNLKIHGGIINGHGCLLDSIQYGTKLANQYNNYVNPFFLEDILSNEGFNFFVDYYADDIKQLIIESNRNIDFYKNKISIENGNILGVEQFLKYK